MDTTEIFFDNNLIDRLPDVRGKLIPNGKLADQSWFRVGGPAEVLYRPADVEDLAFFLAGCPKDIPITVLGAASNVLIRDGGVPGVVIRFGPTLSYVHVESDGIHAGAGAIDLNVARTAQNIGITGMEFLCGIPGTIGGGLRMNAGAYGREFKDIVFMAKVAERDGTIKTLTAEQIGFSYRATKVPKDTIFIEAHLVGEAGDPDIIAAHMREIQKSKHETQPIGEKTGGSTFANPENDPKGRKAWQLIEEAGCRGMKIGQAKVSEKHCNFLINTGYATAEDLEKLGEEVRRRVFEKFGIELRWEIKRIGVAKKSPA
ncbi:MAG: UDP-N-acetylmuramate dehydrogenase [Alphaproteobacteria bacterium]|nr:UDP-N-acetylmuramate dehydrogenase [Alphaproteobacteria bacterium]